MISGHIELKLYGCCRRAVFQPYTRQQLETIAKTRLEGLDVFESRAIEYAARKVHPHPHPHPACTCSPVTAHIACQSSCNQEWSVELHVAVGAHTHLCNEGHYALKQLSLRRVVLNKSTQ